MKKYIITIALILIITINFIFIFYYFIKINKQFQVNNTLLIKKDIEITNLASKLIKNNKPLTQIEKTNALCYSKAEMSVDIRECTYKSADLYEKERIKYLKLIQQVTTEEEYKLIKSIENNWEIQRKKDEDIITKFILNHGGTMYYDIAAGDYNDIIEDHAKFLKYIYEEYAKKNQKDIYEET